MPLKSKHTVEEINGIRCTVVEKGIPSERVAFLKDLLEFNKLEVVIAEESKTDETAPTLYNLGVTNIVFNPTIAVYEMDLKTRDGKNVSPAYWEQYTTEMDDEYWNFVKK
jgi:hypothetical protein